MYLPIPGKSVRTCRRTLRAREGSATTPKSYKLDINIVFFLLPGKLRGPQPFLTVIKITLMRKFEADRPQGPEEMCLSLDHQNPLKTSEKMGYFDRVTVSLHIL